MRVTSNVLTLSFSVSKAAADDFGRLHRQKHQDVPGRYGRSVTKRTGTEHRVTCSCRCHHEAASVFAEHLTVAFRC